MKTDFIYETVNGIIIKQLEKGIIPWKKTWKSSQFPINLETKKNYNGFNFWLLLIMQSEKQYTSNVWATYRQIINAGGQVKKGEKSTMIVYWKVLEFLSKTKKDKHGKPKKEKIPLLRYYNVFNLDQTTGIELKGDYRVVEANTEADAIVGTYSKEVRIEYGHNEPYYSPKNDFIAMPDKGNFDSDNEFYATLFHEMIHSTGHHTRLKRFETDEVTPFGSESYSKEELIAEMGSAYLSAHTNILPTVLENTGAYIKGWLGRLNDDKSLLISAAGKAQKAVEYITKTV